MGVGGAARERGERDEGWDEISWIRSGFSDFKYRLPLAYFKHRLPQADFKYRLPLADFKYRPPLVILFFSVTYPTWRRRAAMRKL
jgi:hypothetical protein